MVLLIDNRGEHEFVIEAERELPKEQQTVWLLKPLARRQLTRVLDLLSGDGQRVTVLNEVARASICGFRNLKNADGKEIEFETGKQEVFWGRTVRPLEKQTFESIPMAVVSEIAAEVIEISDATEDEQGN